MTTTNNSSGDKRFNNKKQPKKLSFFSQKTFLICFHDLLT